MPTSLQPTASANTPQQKEARRRGTGFCIARKCSSSRPASTRFWRFLHGWVLTCRLQCRSASAGLRALLSQRWVSDGESFESLPLWPQQRTGIRLDVSWLVDGSTTRRVARTALGFLGCIPWWSLSGFSDWWYNPGRLESARNHQFRSRVVSTDSADKAAREPTVRFTASRHIARDERRNMSQDAGCSIILVQPTHILVGHSELQGMCGRDPRREPSVVTNAPGAPVGAVLVSSS
jgi:hypothetical protein